MYIYSIGYLHNCKKKRYETKISGWNLYSYIKASKYVFMYRYIIIYDVCLNILYTLYIYFIQYIYVKCIYIDIIWIYIICT